MAIVKKNPVATEKFLSSEKPDLVTAKKGVQSLDINTFILYEQQNFPTGNNWVGLQQVVLPTTDFLAEGTINKYGATSFIQLADVPQTYTGASLKSVRVNAAETGLEFFIPAADFITATSDTNTIDLTVAAATLTADVRHQDTATIKLSDDPGGLKADFASMNISQFVNDVPYLVAADLSGYVPYIGATADLNMGVHDIYGSLIHAHRAFELGDKTAGNFHLHIVLDEDLTADKQLSLVVNDGDRTLTIAGSATISGTNTGDQTSIVGISGTMAQFDTACSDGNFVYESDLAAGIATWLATPSSANLLAAVTDETGTGLLVFNNSPTFLDDITVGTAATSTGQILFKGTTSGTVTLSVADAAGTWTMKLPTTDGGVGEFLQTDGSGNTTWAAGGSGANTALSNLAAVAINTSLLPGVDDTIDLGSSSKQWNALYLGDGGFIGWNGAIDGSIQVSGAVMSFANSTEYNFDAVIKPSAANIDLGVTSTAPFRSIFLTTKIDFNNGDVIATAGVNTLTFTGASSGYSFDAATTIGTGNAFTCGTIELGAASDTTLSRSAAGVLAVEGVPVIKATAGVLATPTSTTTSTITHGLGRTPVIIRVHGIGSFVNSTSATPTPHSHGTWTVDSGNTCVYMTSAGTSAQAPQTSTTFSVFVATSSGNTLSGIVQNVGVTTFDIAWTETGTTTAQAIQWDAQ